MDEFKDELLAPWLADDAWLAAPRLLGCRFIRELGGKTLVAQIVEVEAYDQTDAASHSYRGRTARNQVMFGAAGRLYVYFTYGMHYCMNVVTRHDGYGSGVLIRAVEPLKGLEVMAENRGGKSGYVLTNGPAKVTQALGVDMALGGHDLRLAPLQLVVQPPLPQTAIMQTTRVGISRERDKPWRFYIKDNPYVSRV